MLRGAARQRQPQELAAQVLRIVGTAVLTAAGLVPEGNTGGANVSAFRRLPVPPFDSTEVTPHGFRATACTLLNELGWRSEAIERQMAHGVSDSIRRHYNHAQHLPERRVMMQAWADYLVRLKEGAVSKWVRAHPATVAPAGSNRSSRGGDEAAEAFGVEGHVSDLASTQAVT